MPILFNVKYNMDKTITRESIRGAINMQRVIYVNKYLTSAKYYDTILPEIQTILKYYDKVDDVIFDFSGTNTIEPNVVPNLLCMGNTIYNVLGRKAIIRIPETYEGGRLKKYCYSIGFTELAKRSFEFEADPYTGFEGKNIDPLCGTVFFSENVTEDTIGQTFDQLVGPFAERYLDGYSRISLFSGQRENDIINLLKELAANAREHSNSYSYATVHAKYSEKKIYIAISDNGIGFLQSCREKHCKELEQKNRVLYNEIDAIDYCVYRREERKKFGLYSVIKDVLDVGGKVRIHSNDSQIIYTERVKEGFINKTLFNDWGFKKYNVRRDLIFGGTHIEIEIPF